MRAVPLEAGAGETLEDWLPARAEKAEPLFVRIRRGGHIGSECLADQAIYHIEATRVAAAGVAGFSPQIVRRTFACDLIDAGVDLYELDTGCRVTEEVLSLISRQCPTDLLLRRSGGPCTADVA